MFVLSLLAAAARRRLDFAYKGAIARKSMRSLLGADDRLLKDIGLTRADVIDAFSSPLTDDPSNLLIARRKESDGDHVTVIDSSSCTRNALVSRRASLHVDRAAA